MSLTYLLEYESPIGTVVLASDGERLCGLWFEGQRYFQDKLDVRLGHPGEHLGERDVIRGPQARRTPGISAACDWLDAYFDGAPSPTLPPLALRGAPFQEEVWRELEVIPCGTLTTYGDVARAIAAGRDDGTRVSARAVGAAVGHNPISVIVPCHRVVGSTGSLTGYAGGIWRKTWLLEHEGVDLSRLKVPAT